MARHSLLTIFVAILLCHFRVSSDNDQLRREIRQAREQVFRAITALKYFIRGPAMVTHANQGIQAKYKNNILLEVLIQHKRDMEKSLYNVLETMTNLTARFEGISTEVNNLKNDSSRVEALSHSHQMTANKIKVIGSALIKMEATVNNTEQMTANITEVGAGALNNLQNVTRMVATLDSSLEMMSDKADILYGTSEYYSHKTESIVQGIIVGGDAGLVTVALQSHQQARLSNASAKATAFDWNSRNVYWAHKEESIKRGNPDGSGLKVVGEVKPYTLAVDSISGNWYFNNVTASDIRVCSRHGDKCSIIATNQTDLWDMAVYPSASLMFWTYLGGASIVRANMDGSNVSVISLEHTKRIIVDEASDRIYWIGSSRSYIASSDLHGNDRRVLLNDDSADLNGIAIHGDLVYFAKSTNDTVHAVSKNGGNATLIAEIDDVGFLEYLTLYGTKTLLLMNPCESSPCSHLCVPRFESFTCLCPEGAQVNQDRVSCSHFSSTTERTSWFGGIFG